MTVQDRYARLPLSSIKIAPDRQRSQIDVESDGLKASVLARGVLVPLLVREDGQLVAGQRRYTASLDAGLPDVPVRYVSSDLSDEDLELIELEENIRRAELPWRDECRAVARLHAMWQAKKEGWTQAQSNTVMGFEIKRYLRVAQELGKNDSEANPRLQHATSVWAAYNICSRIDARTADQVLEDISYAGASITASPGEEKASASGASEAVLGPISATVAGGAGRETVSPPDPASTVPSAPTAPPAPTQEPEAILNLSFLDWAPTYAGPRFNFIHCDFPYGKNPFSGQWGGKHDAEFQYADTSELYWDLCAALCKNADRLLTPTAHLMFWLSSEIENLHATIEFFRKHDPHWQFQARALIWLKSDNVGIVPDPRRGPRWIVETALMATRGDRPLVKPLASGYNAPTARQLHPSAKPEPVLRHFFGMFVDHSTRMLDPTCGAGSSLRAAESLGADSVLGIEREPQYAQAARKALREFRNLRELTR